VAKKKLSRAAHLSVRSAGGEPPYGTGGRNDRKCQRAPTKGLAVKLRRRSSDASSMCSRRSIFREAYIGGGTMQVSLVMHGEMRDEWAMWEVIVCWRSTLANAAEVGLPASKIIGSGWTEQYWNEVVTNKAKWNPVSIVALALRKSMWLHVCWFVRSLCRPCLEANWLATNVV